jgi:esterase/lipase/1-acyl-sn-glycerol-3-phosphate acyltransferase
MSKTNNSAYRYTALAMNILEKILGSKITVEGLDNIPKRPVLFVANHFTRSETFVVPYVIHKLTKRPVRCLADSGLFNGILGRFLSMVGAVSTKDPKRDLSIVSDLVSGNYDWMIYPEGSMIKSKGINDNSFSTAKGPGRVRTGSAVLALKSELYRNEIIEAKAKNNTDLINYYKQQFNIEYDEKFKDLKTQIVPLNITYYPIRPGDNIIKKTIGRFFKALPKQICEELEIEGNLLLSSNINIHFGKAIDVSSYIKNIRGMIYQIPIIQNETKVNLVLKYLKYRLTIQFMQAIYENTQINLDHLFAAILYFYPNKEIKISHFKNLIYLSTRTIRNLKKYRSDPGLDQNNVYRILSEEKFDEFDSAVELAKMIGIIKVSADGNFYHIDNDKLKQEYSFNEIRIENTLQVIFNEFFLLKTACNVVKKNTMLSEEEVSKRSFKYLFSKDLENYNHDYNLYYNPTLSKLKKVGAPTFLEANSSSGILLVHGYLSAPMEMEEAAKYFNNLGFKIYNVRLKGHGTVSINIEDVTWQDWYNSVNRGYSALRMICSKVFIIGFSTGGLLALLAASRKDGKVSGIACINPALVLNDVRSKIVPGIVAWNHLLEKFKIAKGQLRYVENHSESPNINYSRNYICGVEQLEKLMDVCEKNLEKIECPTLIIQSTNDPVINPKSSKIVFEKMKTNNKELLEIESDNHVIVRGEQSKEVFAKIKEFFLKV